jgi:hypothetical protein
MSQRQRQANQSPISHPTHIALHHALGVQDASEGAFMDPHITGCSVELREEGHSADPSSAGTSGAGGSSIWRYDACLLADPINLAAGMAFLIEHRIADARYKVREHPAGLVHCLHAA